MKELEPDLVRDDICISDCAFGWVLRHDGDLHVISERFNVRVSLLLGVL